MDSRLYCFGGICICVSGVLFHENERISMFRVTDAGGLPVIRYHVQISQELFSADAVLTKECAHECTAVAAEGTFRVLLKDRTEEPLVSEQLMEENCYEVRLSPNALPFWDTNLALKLWRLPDQLLRHKAVLLHASMVLYQGKVILFTAPKQVGKSTQAALWERYAHATVLNGDRALLLQKGDTWYGCASPYCGTSNICKPGSYPIAAVVLLHQAEHNYIQAASTRETMAAFLTGCSYDPVDSVQTETIVDTSLSVKAATKVLHLYCTPTEAAVRCLMEQL